MNKKCVQLFVYLKFTFRKWVEQEKQGSKARISFSISRVNSDSFFCGSFSRIWLM